MVHLRKFTILPFLLCLPHKQNGARNKPKEINRNIVKVFASKGKFFHGKWLTAAHLVSFPSHKKTEIKANAIPKTKLRK